MTQVTSTDIDGNMYQVPCSELVWRPSAYGIVIRNGHILLTEQYKKFHLPGGGVDLGELPEETVVREVLEETGFNVANPKFVDMVWDFYTYDSRSLGRKKHVQSILMFYICEFVGGQASMNGFGESEKLIGDMPKWIHLDDLDKINAGSTIDWRQIVKRAL